MPRLGPDLCRQERPCPDRFRLERSCIGQRLEVKSRRESFPICVARNGRCPDLFRSERLGIGQRPGIGGKCGHDSALIYVVVESRPSNRGRTAEPGEGRERPPASQGGLGLHRRPRKSSRDEA